MSEADLHSLITERLNDQGVDPKTLDALAQQLVWRIGKGNDDGPIIVRMGFATSVSRFNDLPKLRNASDSEIEAAVRDGNVRVEWVEYRPG